MFLPLLPLTSSQNLNFNCYFETEKNHIISYSPVILSFFFLSLSLSFFQIKAAYNGEEFPIKSVITQSINCGLSLNATLQLSFYTGIPSEKTIKGVFEAALKGGKISSLTDSNTDYTITFSGK